MRGCRCDMPDACLRKYSGPISLRLAQGIVSMWRSAALVSQFLRAASDIHTRVFPQSDPYMFLCWHNIKSKVSLATVQDSKIWTVALSAIEISPFRYKGAVLSRFPCGLMVLTSPVKVFIC